MRNNLTFHVFTHHVRCCLAQHGLRVAFADERNAIFKAVYHILIPITSEKVLKNFKRSSEDMDMQIIYNEHNPTLSFSRGGYA